MKYGKMKFNLGRPFVFAFAASVFAIGLFLSWLWATGAFLEADAADPLIGNFLKFLTMVFLFAGPVMLVTTFKGGTAYTQISKCSLDELDSFAVYDNGLVVVYENFAELFTDRHERILKRGYVRIHSNFNRKKERIDWDVLPD